ncbi:MAG: ABC transporter permease [Bacteroidales bacterium]
MSLTHLKQTLRLLFKEKRITFLNIAGLAVSLACTLFMLMWVSDELSYDRFHPSFRQLYRVEEDQYYSGKEPYHVNVTPYVSGPVWASEVPEIMEQCRRAYSGGRLFVHGDQKFFEDAIFAVDSSFFDLFGYKFKYGDAAGSLRDPYTMVLTEETATKYFGDVNPVGQVIDVDQEFPFTVSGVLEKLPRNSILSFDILIPWSFIQTQQLYEENWGSNSIQTYVKLQEGAVDSIVSRKITQVTDKYKENNTIDYMVAPFSRIHLHSYFGYGKSRGAVLYVYIFTAIAIFVLLIACINFMNLSTARSSVRAKEIGLRKLNGAPRSVLIRQHLAESLLQTVIAVTLAILLVLLLLPRFNLISGKALEAGTLVSLPFLIGLLAILLLTTLLAGGYPALYLSSVSPLTAIRDQSDARSGSGLLRKILVVFQFSLAVILITGALVASRQLHYMRSADLGYNPSNLVHIQLRGQLQKEYGVLKEELSALPGVRSATASMQPPYRIGSNAGGISWEGKDPEQDILVSFTAVHYDFAKTMEIPLQEGRDFSSEFPGDVLQDTVAGFIVNRTLADMMGNSGHVGERINFLGINGTIVGVMEDYHFQPVGENIEPMALAPAFMDQLSHMVVRLEPGDPTGAINQIEEKWDELFPQFPFEYEFVQEVIDGMYRSEERMAALLKIFTVVAMILASTGLFALASFTAERRTREIGIRKTLGAHAGQITVMMLRDFSLYIILSLVIALPAVWWLARWWLNDFSNRITLSADLFLITSILTGMVAVLTVSYHAIRTAHTNPVLALHHE